MNEFCVEQLSARWVLDSRGNPTVRVEVGLAGGARGVAIVPSGASTGEHEAVELRDGDKAVFGGKGVSKAVANVLDRLAPAVAGLDARDQAALDHAMLAADGSANKGVLGANAILGVSLAAAHAVAAEAGLPLYRSVGGAGARTLPAPMLNVINGGKHADNNLDFQEFMVQPWGFDDFETALRAGVEIYHALRGLLHEAGLNTAVGDEGGFAPDFKTAEEALQFLERATKKAGYGWGTQVFIALDPAASELANEAKKAGKPGYKRFKSDQAIITSDELIDTWAQWCDNYPVRSIEDGLDENDWAGWKKLTDRLGERVQLVGDDLFVTNIKFLRRGLDDGCANAILVKPNQIGTLSETLEAVDLARRNGYGAVMSHRSGETEDSTIADLAVATNCGQIKTGAPCRSDRNAKYNRLLVIAQELGPSALYGGGA
ncbi:MAG: phosphopyruvate hydratase [Phycisphaeraceae bacterium]|nr:phosphopyruvate hydratase [Phycisphaeraceae bacterium]